MKLTACKYYLPLINLVLRNLSTVVIMRNANDDKFHISVHITEEGATYNLYEERHIVAFIAKHGQHIN